MTLMCRHPHPSGGLCDACEVARRAAWHAAQSIRHDAAERLAYATIAKDEEGKAEARRMMSKADEVEAGWQG